MQNAESTNGGLPPSQPPRGPPIPSGQPSSPSQSLRTGAIFLLALVLAAVFGTALFAGWQFGSTKGTGAFQPGTTIVPASPPVKAENVETVREAVVANVRPSVVQINVATQRGQGIGSGVIIDRRGYVITKNHAIDGAQRIHVMFSNGTMVLAQVSGTSPSDDLAILKITLPRNSTLSAAPLGDSLTLAR